MIGNLRKCLSVQAVWLSLCPLFAFAQSANLAQNLEACKSGSESCDQSKLNAAQLTDVALAGHGRNVVNCRNGYSSCDLADLTEPETIALVVAKHRRNVCDCSDRMQSYDRL